MWVNNIMFQYDQGKPVDILFVSWFLFFQSKKYLNHFSIPGGFPNILLHIPGIRPELLPGDESGFGHTNDEGGGFTGGVSGGVQQEIEGIQVPQRIHSDQRVVAEGYGGKGFLWVCHDAHPVPGHSTERQFSKGHNRNFRGRRAEEASVPADYGP